jgi:predicted porin
MKYKTLALAVAGVFAAPAFAQTSNVTLYGRANLGVDSYRATGSVGGAATDFKSRTRVYDSGSRVGVRGVEQLGGGLRAIFQVESGANIDSGGNTGQGGQANASTGFFASRDSFVGLEGGFGRLTFGRQSVWWVNGTIIQTGANYINAEVPWLNMAGMGRLGVGVARQNNIVAYTTPTFGGFNATAYWSPTAGAGFSNSEASQGGANTNSRIVGGTARFAIGPIALQGDVVETRERSDLPIAGATPKVRAWKFLGGWTYLPGAQISGIFGQVKRDQAAAVAGFTAAGDDVKQNMFGVSWEHTFGNIQGLAQYSQLGKISGCSVAGGCDNTKARGWMVGARYLMSKRTAAYLTYNQITNQSNQVADYGGGAITSSINPGGVTNPGADPRIIAIGVIHNF